MGKIQAFNAWEVSVFTVKFIIFRLETWSMYADFGWLGIRYIISELKKENDILITADILDARSWRESIESIISEQPDVVAIPALQQNLRHIKEFSEQIKNKLPKCTIIIGNLEATMHPEQLLKSIPHIDVAVIGEGEHTFCELIKRIRTNQELTGCKGICYRYKDILQINEPRDLEVDIDVFSFPDRDLLSSKHMVYDIITSRGCYGNCTFCSNKSFRFQPGPKVRSRSLGNVMDEIQYLIQQYRASYISISDDTFCDNDGTQGFTFDDFNEELMKRKINVRFRIQLRSENVNNHTIKAIQTMHKLGLDNIFIGFEAGNKADLKLYGKIATLEDNQRALHLLNIYDLPYTIGFMMFNPYTTLDRLRENINFLKQGKCIITPYILSSRMRLYNGAAIIQKVLKDGLLTTSLDDIFAEERNYKFSNDIELIWNGYNQLNHLDIRTIEYDMVDSSFKHMIAIGHPLLRHGKTKDVQDDFYHRIQFLKTRLLEYCEDLLDHANDPLYIEQQYSKLEDDMHDHVLSLNEMTTRLISEHTRR